LGNRRGRKNLGLYLKKTHQKGAEARCKPLISAEVLAPTKREGDYQQGFPPKSFFRKREKGEVALFEEESVRDLKKKRLMKSFFSCSAWIKRPGWKKNRGEEALSLKGRTEWGVDGF